MDLSGVPGWVSFFILWSVFGLFLIFNQPDGYWSNVWQALKTRAAGGEVDLRAALDPKFSLAHQTMILAVLLTTFWALGFMVIEEIRGYPVDRFWQELASWGTGAFTMVWFVINLLKPPRPPMKKPAKSKLARAGAR